MSFPRAILGVATAAAAVALTSPAPAAESEDDAFSDWGNAITLIALGVPLNLGGIVTAIGTGATLGDEPPPVGWPAAGFVLGGLNLVVGGMAVGFAAAYPAVHPTVQQISFGVTGFTIGAANIILAGLGAARLSSAGSSGETGELPRFSVAVVPAPEAGALLLTGSFD